jgi:CheY-like chemotaxis protein
MISKPMKPSHYDSQGKLGVLSVDDDSVNLMVIESLLAPKGWRVISVQVGSPALFAPPEPARLGVTAAIRHLQTAGRPGGSIRVGKLGLLP